MIGYLKNITEPAAKTILKNVAKSISDQCDKIIKQDGKVAVDIDSRLEEKVKELEDLVKMKKEVVDEYDKKSSQVKKFDEEIAKLNATQKKLRREYESYQKAETSFQRTKDTKFQDEMKKYQKSYETYLQNEKDIDDLEKKKEPVVKELTDLDNKLKSVDTGYGRSKRDSYNHWLSMVSKKVDKLEQLREQNDRMIASNMKNNKEKFVNIFTNPSEVENIINVIEYSLVRPTGGKFGTVGRQLQENYFINTLDELSPDDYAYMPFEHINDKEKCRKTYNLEGRTYTVYDMDELSEDAVRKGFYVALQNAIQTVGKKHMDRMFYEANHFESYKENEKEEADTDKKRVDFSVQENGIFSRPNDKDFKKTVDTSEISQIWKKIASEIKKEVDDMADTTYQSAIVQLPANSYYRNISEKKAENEFKSIFNKLITLYGTSIENGGEVKSSVVQKYISTTGSITESDKSILGAIISTVFNMKILELLEENFTKRIRSENREKEKWEENFLRGIGTKYRNLSNGLYDYRKVKASRRAAAEIESKRIARETISLLCGEEFEEPAEAADRLLREKRDY